MPHRTADHTEDAAQAELPLDIALMRTSVRRALTEAPAWDDMEALALLAQVLRGHMGELIPAVEAAAGKQPKDSIPRHCALACIGEANRKLRIGNGDQLAVRIALVEKLGRSVNALCDHLETLGKP